MGDLSNKVDNVLGEAHILILGAQILLGFQLNSIFHKGFDLLPEFSRELKVCALVLLMIAIVLLIAPVAFHRIVDRGEESGLLLGFTQRLMLVALLPFAFGLGIDLFIVFARFGGMVAGMIAGVGIFLVAIGFWYLLELVARSKRSDAMNVDDRNPTESTSLKEKVKQLLTEARVVLPGAQASLGFQLIAVMTESFERLPDSSKSIHLASLLLTAIATILLMAPAAYHRIVDHGNDTEEFHRIAGKMILSAMIPLGIGLCGDLYVVIRKVFDTQSGALAGSIVMFLLFAWFWFVYPMIRRSRSAGDRDPVRA